MATFTWSPQTADKTFELSMNSASFGDGYEQDVLDGINYEKVEWALTFVRPKAEIDTIESFLKAQAGAAFDWTDPDGLTARWKCKGLSRSPQGSLVAASLSATFKRAYGV